MPRTALHELVEQSQRLAPSTKERYLRDVDRFVVEIGGNPSTWTPANTIRFYEQLLTQMKPQSANRVMAAVKYASSRYAKVHQNPLLDFAAMIELAAELPTEKRDKLSDEDAQKVLTSIQNQFNDPRALRDYALFVLLLDSGARRMSLAGLCWENIANGFAKVPMKGIPDHSIPMTEAMTNALLDWKLWLEKKEKKLAAGPVFRRLRPGFILGPGISDQSIYKIVVARCQEAGLDRRVFPHILRHTYVTSAFERGFSPVQVAAVTGHTLRGSSLGAMAGYIDRKAIGAGLQERTPDWLRIHVDSKRR